MNPTNQDIISTAAQKACAFLAEYGALMVLDIQYTDHAGEITQVEIDSVPSFQQAGLTVADLAAAVYALKMIKVQMDTINIDTFVKVAGL